MIANLAKESLHNKIAAYVNRGGAYQTKGEFDRAVADYDKALELDGKNALILNARAWAERAKGELDKAIADYAAAIEAQPKSASATMAARAPIWRKTISITPWPITTRRSNRDKKFAAAYSGRARVHKAKGDLDKSLADLNEAVRLEPKIRQWLFEQGALLSIQKRLGSRRRRL